MKITKVNTTAGQFRLPVSTELSSVIERMQEPRTKEVADRIASIAMQSRLLMEQGIQQVSEMRERVRQLVHVGRRAGNSASQQRVPAGVDTGNCALGNL